MLRSKYQPLTQHDDDSKFDIEITEVKPKLSIEKTNVSFESTVIDKAIETQVEKYTPYITEITPVVPNTEPNDHHRQDYDTYDIPSKLGFIDKLKIKLTDTTVNIYSNKIILSSNSVIEYDDCHKMLLVWDPHYCENRKLLNNGDSVFTGFRMRNYNGDILFVDNSKTTKVININLLYCNLFVFECEACNVMFEDELLTGRDIEINISGMNEIDLGKSTPKTLVLREGYSNVKADRLNFI
uniref:Uncharacterized protein n=1 Tax=viral metagenome TaxID=1070528 RepID=A0A6C0E9H7_9ZZZZ